MYYTSMSKPHGDLDRKEEVQYCESYAKNNGIEEPHTENIRDKYNFYIECMKDEIFIINDIDELELDPDDEQILGDDVITQIREQFPYNEFEGELHTSGETILQLMVVELRKKIIGEDSILSEDQWHRFFLHNI